MQLIQVYMQQGISSLRDAVYEDSEMLYNALSYCHNFIACVTTSWQG